jgi:adenylosuccinate synthase
LVLFLCVARRACCLTRRDDARSYSSLNITKLDVLSDLAEIKVAVGYRHKGRRLDSFPASLQARPGSTQLNAPDACSVCFCALLCVLRRA